MERKLGKTRIAALSFMIAALLFLSYTLYINNLEKFSQNYETVVLGSDQLEREGISSVRVIVMRHSDRKPLVGSHVAIELVYGANRKKAKLFDGKTDRDGTVDASFKVPADFTEKEAVLTVRASTPEGSDTLSRAVRLYSPLRIHLSSDKPLYKPGETIHIRCLALAGSGLTPASGPSLLEVFDSRGNKVFKKSGNLSAFGVAGGDFTLGREINTGTYKIRSTAGNESVEKDVEVRKYVLPKYKITVKTEKPCFSPQETLKGTVQAAYFFGKPLSGAKVWIDVSTAGGARQRMAKLTGETGVDGSYRFSMKLSDYLSQSRMADGRSVLILQTTVIDDANHRESAESSVAVSNRPLIITALPEAGKLVPGVENTVYVLATHPDGSPASASISLQAGNKNLNLSTGESGFTSFSITPSQSERMLITATTSTGIRVEDTLRTEFFPPDTPLLRLDKALYKANDRMALQILSGSKTGSIYIDLLRGKRLLATKTVDLRDGRGSLEIALTPDMAGLLEIRAFRFSKSGDLLADTRKAYVAMEKSLTIGLSQNSSVYRPGEKGKLTFTVTDEKGSPAAAALGVQIVDESLFALRDTKAGMEKAFFLLGSDTLKPKQQIYNRFTEYFNDMAGSRPEKNADDMTRLAFIASATNGEYGINLNSYAEKAAKISATKRGYYRFLKTAIFVAFLVIFSAAPFLVFLYTVINGILKLKDQERYFSLERKPEGTKSLLFLVFGYIALAVLPALTVLLVFITEHRGHGGWLGEHTEHIAIAMVIADLILILIYMSALGRASRSGDIKGSSTMLPTYLTIIVFLGSVAAFFLFLVFCYFTKYSPDNVIEGPETLALTFLISFFTMPVFLLISMGSHMLRPVKRAISPAFIGMTLFSLLMLLCFHLYWQNVARKGFESVMSGRGSYVYEDSSRMPAGGPIATGVPRTSGIDDEGALAPQSVQKSEVYDRSRIGIAGSEAERKDAVEEAPAPETVYLRQFFPETMYANPELITDESGKASVDLDMADSITTWRTSAFASSKNGALGSAQFPLKVFQDFFIDLDLPSHLTRGDEVSVPVALYNYLGSSQKVRLELTPSSAIEAIDGKTREVTLAPGAVSVAYFKVVARQAGYGELTVTGFGSKMHDAVKRTVEIEPGGKMFSASDSGWLKNDVTYSFKIPADSVPGSGDIQIKLYPGMLSQTVEGLEKILQMPYGCFEQTSSTVYPNIMAVQYLKRTGKTNANIETRAAGYLNAGYQRLLTFEVQGGGFSLYGQAPASTWLSAYALAEFNDMKSVHEVDDQIIERTAQWLEKRADQSGAYDGDLRTTAYVAAAMLESGRKSSPSLKRSMEYIRKNAAQQSDPYALGLCAYAMSLYSPEGGDTAKLLEQLAGKAVRKDSLAYWGAQSHTLCYGCGDGANVEATSLTTMAMLNSHSYPELVQGAVNYLAKSKSPGGIWYSTQATVLALKTLLASMSGSAGPSDGKVEVTIGGKTRDSITMTPDQSDVLKIMDLKKYASPGENIIALKPGGKLSGMYQIVGSYYMPWRKDMKKAEPFTVKLDYDRREVKVGGAINATCSLKNNLGEMAPMVMAEIGIPPGFSVADDEFEKLLSEKQIDRYEMAGHKVVLYIGNLNPGQGRAFRYRMTALFPIKAVCTATRVYQYYDQEKESFAAPAEIVAR